MNFKNKFYTLLKQNFIFDKAKNTIFQISKNYYNKNYKIQNIDVAETLSNIKGKYIKKISNNYIQFEDGEIININNR